MAIDTTATQGTPYWDDYSQRGNSAKNYLRVLFQPGRSVQVRELNQMQSAIQDQIDKFGQNIFVDGARVLDGDINIDNKVQWVDVSLTGAAQSAANDTSRPLVGKKIYAKASSPFAYSSADVSATITDYELKADNEYRFYLRYTSSATDFAGGSRIQTSMRIGESISGTGYSLTANDIIGTGTDAIATGYACKIHNAKGVYFVKGYFVEAASQIKYIDTSGGNSSGFYASLNGKVGFTITENTITAVNDSTLYDNADGSTNFSAPGADRYSIALTLVFISDDSNISSSANVVATTAADVVDTVSVVNSTVADDVSTKYNILGETLAQRTFEESGDYALQPFQLDLREDFNNGFNRGRSTSGDPAKYTATLEPSIAYIKGQRIDIRAKQTLTLDKARTTELQESVFVQAAMGSYIEVDTITYLPTVGTAEAYTIQNVTTENTSDTTNDVATCKIAGIEYTGKKYRLYLTDISMVGTTLTFADGRAIFGDSDSSGGAASAQFKGLCNAGSQGTVLFDVEENNKLFRLPADTIKTLESVSASSTTIKIPVRETVDVASVTTSVAITLSAGSFYHDNPNEYIVVRESDGAVFEVTNVALSGSGLTTATLTLESSVGGSQVNVTYSKRITATKGVKTKGTINTNLTAATYAVGDVITLSGQTDVISVDFISSGSNGTGTSYINNFVLDDGQTGESYGDAKLICQTAITASTALYIKITKLNVSSAGDFFSVDSYPIADTLSATEIERIQIPFRDHASLTDYLDFRDSGHQTLDPNGIIEIGAIENYLPRHDRIALSSAGNFLYLPGDAAANAPKKVPEDSMLLYDLDVPAYTNSVADIEIGYIDNRRYTMRDIGKIERRVKNLEYYSSLSLLEKATSDKQIFDSTGDRFKNGILVDEFKGHQTGDVGDPGYLTAMEPEEGIARPTFTAQALSIRNTDTNLSTGSGTQDVTISGSAHVGAEDLVRLPITSVNTLIDQPFASVAISVNPFDVASWVGEIKLSPSTDEWRDTTRRPDVIIKQDGNADAIMQIMNETLASVGTRWNDWNTTWRGVTKTQNLGWQTMGGAMKTFGNKAQHQRNCKCGHANRITVPGFNGGTLSITDQRRARIKVEARTTTTKQIRTGIQQFAEEKTLTQSLGDKVVDVSFVPFIRSRKVYFNATGFKPNTVLTPFFDDTNISGYTVADTSYSPTEFRDDAVREDTTGQTTSDVSSVAITTDESGRASGYFVLPNNDELRFRTGEREFRLVDNTSNDLSVAGTYGTTTYTARGMLQTVEEQILSTRTVQISERQVTQRRQFSRTETAATAVKHVDPLAQTFLVDPDQYKDGVFLKDIDLFFKQKHDSLPVRIQIVTAENGIPTQKIVPFSMVEKQASEVTINAGSATATTATTFTFESLVHLKAGIEYAIVVLSNSPDYFLWHSEVGGDDVSTGKRITKNPYTGVALKSQNASTWTPDQNKDFKMKLRYAKFFESGSSISKTVGNSSSQTAYGDFSTIIPATISSSNRLKIDAIDLIAETVTLPDTDIQFFIKLTNVAGTTSTFAIEPDRVLELPESINIDASADVELYCTLVSENPFLTPVLDTTRLSLLTFGNTINAPTFTNLTATADGDTPGELSANHGSANARYLTKTIALNNSASQLDVYVDVKRPSPTCNVHAYARFSAEGNFIKLQSAEIPIGTDFSEVHFTTDTSTGAAQQEINFEKFQVKLVMTVSDATNTAIIPQLQNFRAIATA